MTTKQKEIEFVNLEDLGLSTTTEPDREQLTARPAMLITEVRFDYKTRYWDEKTKTGTPIVKINAHDLTSDEPIKFWTLSSVVYKNMVELVDAVGVLHVKDKDGIMWMVFKKSVKIGGFEEVPSKTRGQNAYLKMLPVSSVKP